MIPQWHLHQVRATETESVCAYDLLCFMLDALRIGMVSLCLLRDETLCVYIYTYVAYHAITFDVLCYLVRVKSK